MTILDKELMYPLSEDINCLILYEHISKIIINIMLKLVQYELIVNLNIDCSYEIEKIQFKIKELSSEEILLLNGFGKEEIKKILVPNNEALNYRIAENTSDVNMLMMILESIFVENK